MGTRRRRARLPGVSGQRTAAALLAIVIAASAVPSLRACPFCTAASPTLSDRLKVGSIAVLARYVEPGPKRGRPAREAIFEVARVLSGASDLGGVTYFGAPFHEKEAPDGAARFLLVGVDPPDIYWSPPIRVSERAIAYLDKLGEAPPAGPDRLAYFQGYLRDEDPVISQDAYDEFAKASYPELKAARKHLQRETLLAWIADPAVSDNRRRLFLTMLGVCGREGDAAMLEERIFRQRTEIDGALDATIACYLTLRQTPGVDVIEERIIKDPRASFADVNAAVLAFRFHGQDEQVIPRPRLAAALRSVLQNKPALADLVIPDLARWEDWSVLPELVRLFKESDEKTQYLRVPIVNYVAACPLPEAKGYLAELEQIDADAVRRARAGGGFLRPVRSGGPGATPPAAEVVEVAPSEDPSADEAAPGAADGDETATEAPSGPRRRSARNNGRAVASLRTPPPVPTLAVGLSLLGAAGLITAIFLAIFFGFRP